MNVGVGCVVWSLVLVRYENVVWMHRRYIEHDAKGREEEANT